MTLRDRYGRIIGWGESTLWHILKTQYPKLRVRQQIPIEWLIKPSDYLELSSRASKETIDVVLYSKPRICFRVQDDRHKSLRMSHIDDAQKFILEKNGNRVIDIWEDEYPALFMETYDANEVKKLSINIGRLLVGHEPAGSIRI